MSNYLEVEAVGQEIKVRQDLQHELREKTKNLQIVGKDGNSGESMLLRSQMHLNAEEINRLSKEFQGFKI